jgi:release factor glutamine methyltransferase
MNSKKAILPSLDHFLMQDFEHIYEPSDDTFLLCDALENDRSVIKLSDPSNVLEIGCGSGCVITFLSKLLNDEGIKSNNFATDINPYAIASCKRTAEANHVTYNVTFLNYVRHHRYFLIRW